jgi:hypothetical protein
MEEQVKTKFDWIVEHSEKQLRRSHVGDQDLGPQHLTVRQVENEVSTKANSITVLMARYCCENTRCFSDPNWSRCARWDLQH